MHVHQEYGKRLEGQAMTAHVRRPTPPRVVIKDGYMFLKSPDVSHLPQFGAKRCPAT
jgi:hypothetical protein